MQARRLILLGDGVYTVSEVCRILQPTMTSRKIHYWLDTGLISGYPISRGRKGVPTLLTFRQLLEIRTVQHLRDELDVTLPRVRHAFSWILNHVFDRGETVQFRRGPSGVLTARTESGEVEVPGGQGLLSADVNALSEDMVRTHREWNSRGIDIRGYPSIVSNAGIVAGSPTIRGTRIETSIIAAFATPDKTYDNETVAALRITYPRLTHDAIADALLFEGVRKVG